MLSEGFARFLSRKPRAAWVEEGVWEQRLMTLYILVISIQIYAEQIGHIFHLTS